MFWVVAVMMFSIANQEFLEMVDTQTQQGYTWERVEKTEVTDEIALPVVDQITGKKYYYYYLTEPN